MTGEGQDFGAFAVFGPPGCKFGGTVHITRRLLDFYRQTGVCHARRNQRRLGYRGVGLRVSKARQEARHDKRGSELKVRFFCKPTFEV